MLKPYAHRYEQQIIFKSLPRYTLTKEKLKKGILQTWCRNVQSATKYEYKIKIDEKLMSRYTLIRILLSYLSFIYSLFDKFIEFYYILYRRYVHDVHTLSCMV